MLNKKTVVEERKGVFVDKRASKILSAIIDEYVRTGEPIGSKALAEKPEIGVSSATIRNTMAALEQEGYLDHPHTSAGRVPTYKGFRYYIENLMAPEPINPDKISAPSTTDLRQMRYASQTPL